jgi:holin-like protein
MGMILGLIILLCFQLMGEWLVAILHLIIPGPVLGMVLFFMALFVWPQLRTKVESLSRFMNSHLALFFIPAGVGMMKYYDLFVTYGSAMFLTLILSTATTMAAAAIVFQFLLKKTHRGDAHE